MEEDPCLSRERDTSDPPAQQGSGGQGRRNPYRTGLQLLLPGGHVSAAVPGVGDCLGEGGRGSGLGQSHSGRIQPCGKAWPGLGSPRSDVKRGRPRHATFFLSALLVSPSLCSTHSHRRGRGGLPRTRSSQIPLAASRVLFSPCTSCVPSLLSTLCYPS